MVAGAAAMGGWTELTHAGPPAPKLAVAQTPSVPIVEVTAHAPLALTERRYIVSEAAARAARPLPRPCGTVLSGAQPGVAMAGNYLKTLFSIGNVGGRSGRSGWGDHPRGLALDFMTNSTATGNALADFVLAHRQQLGVTYVIYRQRYNDGHGWSMMENRGSPTANHMDHVHVSFQPGAHPDVTC